MDEFKMPEGFEKIWERVTAHRELDFEPISDCERLEKFIFAEQCILAQYAKILEKCASKERPQIARMTAGQRQIIRQLQVEYFIKKGDIMPAKKLAKLKENGTLSMLRELYRDECHMAEDYISAGKQKYCDMAELYTEIAGEKTQRATDIKAMIGRNM